MGWLFSNRPERPEESTLHTPTDASTGSGERLMWTQACVLEGYRGQWVALDECTYDEATGKAVEGAVVDSDQDLSALCQRLRDTARKHCAVLFCDESNRKSLRPESSNAARDPFAHSAHR